MVPRATEAQRGGQDSERNSCNTQTNTCESQVFDGFQSENSTEERQSGPDAVKLQE